jgi:hypothetical protein
LIDLCIVATLRPELLRRTLESFKKYVKYSGEINPIINIDMVPKSDKELDIISQMIGIVKENIGDFRKPTGHTASIVGNFAKAVKTVWENTTSEYVFHLEDDWEFLKKIDLDWCVYDMKCNNYDYLRFPKIGAAHLNCMYKVALQPSLWKGSVVRSIANEMKIDKDPEKQLRTGQGNEPLDKILIEVQNKGLKDYDSNCCKDIGRKWRDKQGLKKWNAVEPDKVTDKNRNSKNITWWK